MKNIYIIKLGGSIITEKDKKGIHIRHKLISSIAKNIKKIINENKNSQIILLHGGGSVGHRLAKKYNLSTGIKQDSKKWIGALKTRAAIQNLNQMIFDSFIENKINLAPIHTSSVVIQNNKKIKNIHLDTLNLSLEKNCIPILYGDMVFDEELGMSVCSGDTISAYLSEKMNIKKIFFASDIDGIFNKDPHIHKDAKLIEKIKFSDIFSEKIELSASHSTDVTGGVFGKLSAFKNIKGNSLKEIVVFNGLKGDNFYEAFTGKIKSTKISLG